MEHDMRLNIKCNANFNNNRSDVTKESMIRFPLEGISDCYGYVQFPKGVTLNLNWNFKNLEDFDQPR